MGIDAEVLFGQLAVEKGLTRPEHVQECLALLRDMERRRVQPLPRLADLLAEKGYLNLETFDRTVAVHDPAPAEAPAADRPPEVEGERFGKYVRTVKLGEGGMGEVWKAWDTELRRWVAIKFLKSTDKTEIGRFQREARLAARLSHPNIASIYEAGESHIVMQFVDGRSLPSLHVQDPKRIAEIVRQVALALQYAHEQSVVHRDVKPGNVMVDGSGRVFVMDFGLAKSTVVESTVSASGAICGTPSYMSPEQAQGLATLDHRTDVYSLGATLYDLLAGQPPFRGTTAFEVLKKVVEQDPLPIDRCNPLADRDLQTIAMKCMEKDPLRRYLTAQELADDLDRYLRGEPILARPLSSSERMRRYVRRHRAVIFPSVAAVVLALAFAGWLVAERVRKVRLIRSGVETAEQIEREAVGPIALRREKLLKARALLNQTLELDPKDPRTVQALGRVEQKLREVLREEDEVLQRLQSREGKLHRIGKLLVHWGRIHETLDELDAIASDDSLTSEARQQKAKEPWGKFQEFLNGAEKDPTSQATTYALLGYARWLISRFSEGDEWFRKAMTLDPEVPYAHLLMAFARFAADLDDPTLPDGASVPSAPEILEHLRKAAEAPMWYEETKDEFELVVEAIRAVLRGDYKVAERAASSALASPELVWIARDLRAIRARARFLTGHLSDAIEDQGRVAQGRPKNAAARFWLARFKMVQAALREEALRDFGEVLLLHPRCGAAFARKGETLEALSRFREAAEAYEAAVKLLPEELELRKALERTKARRNP